MTESVAEGGEKIVTYKKLETGETFVQLVKEHDCYQVEPEFAEKLKADLENNAKISDLKAKLRAEKQKPEKDFRAIRKAKRQAKIAEEEAVQIEDAVIVGEEPI